MRMLALVAALSCAASMTAAPIEIPFRWTPGQIEIAVIIDGRGPVWCILDSGAEFSMLDAEVAKELRVDGDDVTWKIGALTMPHQSMRPWKLENFRRQKRDIRGVIGCELFEHYVVTIDFQRRVIVLRESFALPPNAIAFPITFAGRLPVIATRIEFDGKVLPARLMIDTGAQTAVILRQPYTAKHHLQSTKTKTQDSVASGLRPFVTIPATRLHLGKWTWDNPPVEAYATTAGAGGGTDTDGILGNDVLRRFRVTFDYAKKRVVLEETSELRIPFF
jgi:hypothetical protein